MIHELAPQADSLAVRFVSDREMRRLNRTYRDRDRPTDVLSFPGTLGAEPEDDFWPMPIDSDEVSEPEQHLGDIAVSVPTARRQATEHGHSVDRELRLLMLHGVLHCLGYDHETDDGTMERLELTLRQRFIDHG